MAASRGTLAMQRLGVRLIEQRNPDDAIVLGDALQEAGIDALITGRSRPVVFRTSRGIVDDARLRRITTRDELAIILRTRAEQPSFVVHAYEAIYNVGRFAASPNDERWHAIWSMWVTPRRETYRAMVHARLLPRTVRFHEIDWRSLIRYPPSAAELGYSLYLDRLPPNRKRRVTANLFSIERLDVDNPRTQTMHIDEQPA